MKYAAFRNAACRLGLRYEKWRGAAKIASLIIVMKCHQTRGLGAYASASQKYDIMAAEKLRPACFCWLSGGARRGRRRPQKACIVIRCQCRRLDHHHGVARGYRAPPSSALARQSRKIAPSSYRPDSSSLRAGGASSAASCGLCFGGLTYRIFRARGSSAAMIEMARVLGRKRNSRRCCYLPLRHVSLMIIAGRQ